MYNDLMSMKTRRIYQNQLAHYESSSHLKNELNSLENTLKRKQQNHLETPKNRSISSYTPFNIDESRI